MDPGRTDVMVTAVISKTYFSPSTAEANNGQQIWHYRESTPFIYISMCIGLHSINYLHHMGYIQTAQCLKQKE